MRSGIDLVLDSIDRYNDFNLGIPPEEGSKYYDKYVVRIPDSIVIPRSDFILAKCEGKVVLDIGCVGPLHEEIMQVAKESWGIDQVDGVEYPNYFKCDLSYEPIPFPIKDKFDIIVCGEIIEHLINPGQFLMKLHEAKCPIIITVPNAFGESGFRTIKKLGYENVNKDHVAYYSYSTLKVLVEKCKYKVVEFYWYHGEPRLSEGIIFVIHSEVSNGTS